MILAALRPMPPERRSRRFGLFPRTQRGWHLAHANMVRWDQLPTQALPLLGEGRDPDEQ